MLFEGWFVFEEAACVFAYACFFEVEFNHAGVEVYVKGYGPRYASFGLYRVHDAPLGLAVVKNANAIFDHFGMRIAAFRHKGVFYAKVIFFNELLNNLYSFSTQRWIGVLAASYFALAANVIAVGFTVVILGHDAYLRTVH